MIDPGASPARASFVRIKWPIWLLMTPSLIVAVWLTAPVLSQLLLSFFLAIMLEPVVKLVQKMGLPRVVAIVLILSGLTALFILFLMKVVALVPDIVQLSRHLPQLLHHQLQAVSLWFQEWGIHVTSDGLLSLIDYPHLMEMLTRFASQISGLLSYTLTLLLVLLFMLCDAPALEAWLTSSHRRHHKELSALVLCLHNVTHYMAIRTLTGIVNSLLVWGLFTSYGFNYTLEWALLAFVLNYIPVIGSILASIPPLIYGLIIAGLTQTMTLAIMLTLINIVLGCIVEPLLVGRKLNMSLTAQMVALIFWQMLLGLPGAFMAIPLTYTLKTVFLHKAK